VRGDGGVTRTFFIAAIFGRIMDYLERRGELHAENVPREMLDFVPFILLIIGIVIAIVSIVGIVGAIGVMKRKEWGRFVLTVVSFFNTLRLPVGTALAAYNLWCCSTTRLPGYSPPLPREWQA
jgi:Trk-type K+ transport system membrane component